MMEALLKGFALGFVLVLSVGPVIFTIIKQSLTNGHRGGFAFVAGVWFSDIFLVVLSNVFTALVSTLMEYKKTIGVVGGFFLLAMGIYYLFFKKITMGNDPKNTLIRFSKSDYVKTATSGFLINTLNPSVILFWLINATAFAATHTLQQRIIIFSICILLNMLADILKVMLAGKLRERLTVHNITIINKISGSILICFSFALMYSALFLKGEHHL